MKTILRKTALCLLAVLLVLGTLASCSNKPQKPQDPKPFSEVYESTVSVPFDSVYNTKSEFKLPDDATLYRHDSTAVLAYHKGEDICFYNVASDSVVLTVKASKLAAKADISLFDEYFKVIETDPETKKKTTVLYTNSGNKIASAEGDVTASAKDTGILFNSTFYRMKDGEVVKDYPLPPFTSITSDLTFLDDAVVSIDDGRAIFYNDKFELITFYEIPGTALDGDLYLLEDGKLFAQYLLPCDPMEKDYDLLADNAKATLHHELFDPATGEITELNLDFCVSAVINKTTMDDSERYSFDDIFTDAVINIVAYYAIVDKSVDFSADRAVMMDNDGKLGAAMDQYVENQTGLVYPLTNGYYTVATKTGYTVLKPDGEVVKSLSAIATATAYGYYSYSDKKVYNHDFEQVLNLSGYTVISNNDNAILYTDAIPYSSNEDAKYYRYDKNGLAEITAPEGRVLCDIFYSYTNDGSLDTAIKALDAYYVVAHLAQASLENPYPTDTRYSYYSMNGQLLFTTDSTNVIVLAADEDAMLIAYTEIGTYNTLYVRISK